MPGFDMGSSLPFDTIVVGESGLRLSVAEFMALPLDERVALILSRKLQFHLAGAHVDRAAALRSLMQASRLGSSPLPGR